jgi:hypothetical protein
MIDITPRADGPIGRAIAALRVVDDAIHSDPVEQLEARLRKLEARVAVLESDVAIIHDDDAAT